MTPDEKKAFKHLLGALNTYVVADGKVDYRETTSLVGLPG